MNIFEFDRLIEDLRERIRNEKDPIKVFEIAKATLYKSNLGFEEQTILETVEEIMKERRLGVA